MKRLIMLVLLACFCCLGMLAQAAPLYVTIAELREEVAGGWHQDYEVHGRTIPVSVDEIIVPDIDAVPIFTVEAVDAVAPELLDGFDVQDNIANSTCYSLGDVGPNSFYKAGKMWIKGITEYSQESEIEWDAHAEGNRLSILDGYRLVVKEIERLYGADAANQLAIQRVSLETQYYEYNEKTKVYGPVIDHPDNVGIYAFELYQTFYGMPILCVGGGAFDTYLKTEDPNFLMSGINAAVKDERNMYFGLGLVKEREIKENDAPLSSFAVIQSTLESLIIEGKMRSIERIRLGYVLYVDPDVASIGWAVPTWQVYGEMYHDAKEEPAVVQVDEYGETATLRNIGYFYIQAQTGKLIDPSAPSPTRRNAPKILTWDEVE